jgi:hypothetical protein
MSALRLFLNCAFTQILGSYVEVLTSIVWKSIEVFVSRKNPKWLR